MPPIEQPWQTNSVGDNLTPFLNSPNPPARIVLKPIPLPFPSGSKTGPTQWTAKIFYPTDLTDDE